MEKVVQIIKGKVQEESINQWLKENAAKAERRHLPKEGEELGREMIINEEKIIKEFNHKEIEEVVNFYTKMTLSVEEKAEALKSVFEKLNEEEKHLFSVLLSVVFDKIDRDEIIKVVRILISFEEINESLGISNLLYDESTI